jgi:hypothetical protein
VVWAPGGLASWAGSVGFGLVSVSPFFGYVFFSFFLYSIFRFGFLFEFQYALQVFAFRYSSNKTYLSIQWYYTLCQIKIN